MWVQRSLPLVPVLPCLAALLVVQLRARGWQPVPWSWTRPQLVALMLLGFCVLKVATVIADHEIVAYALAG